jgi:hypothetical protein
VTATLGRARAPPSRARNPARTRRRRPSFSPADAEPERPLEDECAVLRAGRVERLQPGVDARHASSELGVCALERLDARDPTLSPGNDQRRRDRPRSDPSLGRSWGISLDHLGGAPNPDVTVIVEDVPGHLAECVSKRGVLPHQRTERDCRLIAWRRRCRFGNEPRRFSPNDPGLRSWRGRSRGGLSLRRRRGRRGGSHLSGGFGRRWLSPCEG